MAMGFSQFSHPILMCFALFSVAIHASPIFYESFEGSWQERWFPSEKQEYTGIWKHEKSQGHEDYGLFVSEKGMKYGISVAFPEPLYPRNKTVVLQYDLRLHHGLDCGGAYLKFLAPQEAGWTPQQFDNKSPYSIMFGPDKCESTNKIHFIFHHKSPKNGAYVEHHLKYPAEPVIDSFSHVYTAVIYPNNSVKIMIDGEVKRRAGLLNFEFNPPVVPWQTIADPDDLKPKDWDDYPQIPDPDAKKPDDWDEDAPFSVEDMDAQKPQGWLDDEPHDIDDPKALKPQEWDTNEYGNWEAPKIPNPKCENAPGCGKWRRPMIKNPAYRGEWHPPMIKNPNFKGQWVPRRIPNPDYIPVDNAELLPIAGVGIDLWTMQDGILFDNILVTTDEVEAARYREKTWRVKHDAEKRQETRTVIGLASTFKAIVFALLRLIAMAPFLASFQPTFLRVLGKWEKSPSVTATFWLIIFWVSTLMVCNLLCGRKQKKKAVFLKASKEEGISKADDTTEEGNDELKDTITQNKNGASSEIVKATGARPRRIRKEI